MDYFVDTNLLNASNAIDRVTGIYVRAMYNGVWGSFDICFLTKKSLLAWLRSRGGKNEWAENVVACLLHGENFEKEDFDYVEKMG